MSTIRRVYTLLTLTLLSLAGADCTATEATENNWLSWTNIRRAASAVGNAAEKVATKVAVPIAKATVNAGKAVGKAANDAALAAMQHSGTLSALAAAGDEPLEKMIARYESEIAFRETLAKRRAEAAENHSGNNWWGLAEDDHGFMYNNSIDRWRGSTLTPYISSLGPLQLSHPKLTVPPLPAAAALKTADNINDKLKVLAARDKEYAATLEKEIKKIEAMIEKDQEMKLTQERANIKANAQIKVIEEKNKGLENAAREGVKTFVNQLREPRTVGYILATIAGILAVYYGAKHLNHKLTLKKPRLVKETSIPTFSQKIFGRKKLKSDLESLVLSPYLQRKVEKIIEVYRKALRNKTPLSNALFYGPPGTGKTFAARTIARESGAYYILTDGASFMQLPVAEAIYELKQIFEFAEKADKPVLIFFDEFDSIGNSRTGKTVDGVVAQKPNQNPELLNALLGIVDKPNNRKFGLIFATNLPNSLDGAILNRVDTSNILHFKNPELDDRIKLLTNYLEKALNEYGVEAAENIESCYREVCTTLHDVSARKVENFAWAVAQEVHTNEELYDNTLTSGHLINLAHDFMEREREREAFVAV